MASRLALLLAGAWLGALLASWAVATVNFRTVDRVLGERTRPELGDRLAPLPPPARREVFRHLASEINRSLFAGFGLVQVAGAALLLALVFPLPGAPRLLAGLALAVVAFQLALGASIASLGRAIDFVPRPLPGEVARRFGMLHSAFVLLDVAKAGLLVAAAAILARR
jgi:hypothetical protein